ncbi:MAG TPA: STAS domain-containing protein [Actinomycetospora sp.]|jgi:ABC-type transporter Mla MlaB component|uniref:STAS domain-containing protein n=1 Tax=Actinomycetospora sp. TaxID=1872135 RepID=UPI002F3E9A81
MTVDAGPRPDAGSPLAHALHVADNEHAQRVGTAAWVDRELAFGAKVYYKGWLGDDGRVEKHWIAGPEGTRRTREALRSGQLEFLDFPTLIERCAEAPEGLTAGLHRIQAEELDRALAEGWPSVAMTQESSRRELADDAEVAEFARQEGGYDTLVGRAPLRVLCQLNSWVENEVHVFESLGVHHRRVVDVGWDVALEDGRWRLRGDLDAHVARRFGGALAGALREKVTGGDLHMDLTEVGFVDVACAQLLVHAARAEPECRRIVLHDPPRLLRRLLDVLQRPASIEIVDGDRP